MLDSYKSVYTFTRPAPASLHGVGKWRSLPTPSANYLNSSRPFPTSFPPPLRHAAIRLRVMMMMTYLRRVSRFIHKKKMCAEYVFVSLTTWTCEAQPKRTTVPWPAFWSRSIDGGAAPRLVPKWCALRFDGRRVGVTPLVNLWVYFLNYTPI